MKKLIKKIAACRDGIGTISKDAKNPFAKSKYASLSTVLATCNKVMSEQGIYLHITASRVDAENYEFTATIHDLDSEETLLSTYTVPLDSTQKNATQAFGSTMTYAQRYIYGILFGIAYDDEDPDAKQQQQPAKHQQQPAKQQPAKPQKQPAQKQVKEPAKSEKHPIPAHIKRINAIGADETEKLEKAVKYYEDNNLLNYYSEYLTAKTEEQIEYQYKQQKENDNND